MRIQRARMRPAVLIHAHRTHEGLPAGELRGRRFGALCRHRQQRLAGPADHAPTLLPLRTT
jgi:hypothetical protein